MKTRDKVWLVILLVGMATAFIVGSLLLKDIPGPAATQVRVESLLILQYEDVNYIIGTVDTLTGEVQRNYIEYLSFLIAQAEDKGIKRAAEAIGFVGPQTVTLSQEPPDAP